MWVSEIGLSALTSGDARCILGPDVEPRALHLDLLAYQCVTIITTLMAHHRRTGSSLKALRVNVGFGVAGTGWRVMLAGVLGLGSWWGW